MPQETVFHNFADVTGLCAHSKKIKKGDLFYFPGDPSQAGLFVPEALVAGAVGVVLAEGPELDFGGKPHIRVKDVRQCFLNDCLVFYRELFSSFYLTGVTGTKGKSTITWLIYSLLKKMGVPVALVGTNGIKYADIHLSSVNTTPGLNDFIALLQDFQAAGIKEVICEVSSQGLLQKRVPVPFFKTRVFTDLSPEHLDAHGNMQNYFQAKAEFFAFEQQAENLTPESDYRGWCLDRSAWRKELENISGCAPASFGLHGVENLLRVVKRTETIEGCRMVLEYKKQQYECRSPLIGFFNAENLLCALSVLVERGFELAELLRLCPELSPAEGRMELIATHNHARIYVDYAHSSQSFEFVLSVLRELVKGRLMGESASKYADVIIVTDDNPRTEDPDLIVDAIKEGIKDKEKCRMQRNRRQAIAEGVSLLSADDVLLVCGKGHEDYQIYGSKRSHFSDREEILRAVKEKESDIECSFCSG
jgi:UDP-N-acetylmuramoyl-L-alanyl-D-glutamate--2,6-diaminopimelate ligase